MASVTYPEGNLLLRNLSKTFPIIERGQGVFLYDESGKDYLDAVSGAYVASVGHGNAEISQRIAQQLTEIAYVNGTQFTNRPAEELATRLASFGTKIGLERVGFLNSGSEAVEAAIKFTRQLAVSRGQEGRTKLLTRTPSYHGNTLFALSASGRPSYKKLYGPLLSEVLTVDSPRDYRGPVKNYAQEGALPYLAELEMRLEHEGAEIFAFLLEPVGGSSMGGQTPPKGYLSRVQALCRKHGVLLIADEVLTGAGRTGTFFASEPDGFCPDVLVLAKGLNGGYGALSALMTRKSHLDEMKAANFMHAQTFMNAPCSAIAGLAVLEFMEKNDLLAAAKERGEYLHAQVRRRLLGKSYVGHVAGRGLLLGLDIVQDKSRGTPYPRQSRVAETLVAIGLEQGITLWPNVGHVDGKEGDLLLVAPPLIISDPEVDLLIDRLEKTLEATISRL